MDSLEMIVGSTKHQRGRRVSCDFGYDCLGISYYKNERTEFFFFLMLLTWIFNDMDF
jgi:hypothetical protein